MSKDLVALAEAAAPCWTRVQAFIFGKPDGPDWDARVTNDDWDAVKAFQEAATPAVILEMHAAIAAAVVATEASLSIARSLRP